MMSPGEEAKDLIANPLPPEMVKAEDRLLPTLIWNYDQQIAQLEKDLADVRAEREEKLARAIKLGCLANKQYSIEKVEILGDRVPDAALLKSRFPSKFQEYVELRTEQIKAASAMKLAKDIAECETKINLGAADKKIGKQNVTSCCTQMVRCDYRVKKNEV